MVPQLCNTEQFYLEVSYRDYKTWGFKGDTIIFDLCKAKFGKLVDPKTNLTHRPA